MLSCQMRQFLENLFLISVEKCKYINLDTAQKYKFKELHCSVSILFYFIYLLQYISELKSVYTAAVAV